MADATPIRRTPSALSDSSLGWRAPELSYGLNFSDYGSYGLRQYGGWIREEFLRELVGREAARTYREMMDNSSIIGAMIFTIQQAMRKVTWRVDPAIDNNAQADKFAAFADSLRDDMTHTWDDFVVEMLSMLPYGYSLHEIVYKRRLGPEPKEQQIAEEELPVNEPENLPTSKYNDGLIGWRRLPIRGQETVIKWFLDDNGQITGVTQQPWVGTLIDIPIEKLLLFRPTSHKNNPEGRSVLRNAYRDYYFVKRLEELESILFERMGGFPVLYVPSDLIDKAASTNSADPDVAAAQRAFTMYKQAISRVRIDEQMGALLPSDPYRDEEGKPTNLRMYDFQLVTPQHGRQTVDPDKTIERHSVQMMTLLADFIKLGHEVRGTNNLAMTRVDMFYAAIEGWLNAAAQVLNRFALPRLFKMNGMPQAMVPRFIPDMPQRLDLDSLGAFIANIAKAGMPLFPNDELEAYVRDAAGFPELDDEGASPQVQQQQITQAGLIKMLMGAAAKQVLDRRHGKQGTERTAAT